MPNVPLNFPKKGITEAFPFSDQPPDTSHKEQNMRVRNPKTGRLTGAQRAGYSRYFSAQITPNTHIQNINSVQIDKANVTFANKTSALDSDDVEVAADTPSGGDCYGAVRDRLGNIYALDGNSGLVKYNSNLVEQFRLSFPTANPDDVIKAIAVDDFLSIYVAVSDGTKHEEAKVFCYIPDVASGAVKLWELEAGGFVKQIKVKGSNLYGVLEDPSTRKAALFSIQDIDIGNPSLEFAREIPHPASDLDIGPDGSFFVAHPFSIGTRGVNPQAPSADPIFESWNPRDYADFDEKIWCWHDAQNIDGQGNATLSEDDDIYAWYDQSGNGRHYYAATDEVLETYTTPGTQVAVTPPTFKSKAQAGLPGVSFDGLSNLMKSKPNESVEFAYRDAQKTGVPAFDEAVDTSGSTIDHTGSAFLMFLCVRVDPDYGGTEARYLWSHEDADVGATDGDRHIIVNRSDGAADSDITSTDQSRITVWEETTGNGSAANTMPASGNAVGDYGLDDNGGGPTFGNALDNTSGVVILTYLCDGNFQSSSYTDTAGVADQTHSLLRINGRPIDRWTSLPNYSLKPDYLGGTGIDDLALDTGGTGSVNRFFRGQILERIVFHRGDIGLVSSQPTTEPLIATHEAFGNAATKTGDTDWPGTSTDQSENLITQVEGYLAHRWGKYTVLPLSSDVAFTTQYPHLYNPKGPLGPSEPSTFNSNLQQDSVPFCTKWSGDSAQPIWTKGSVGGDGVIVASDGQVTCYGPVSPSGLLVTSFLDTGPIPGADQWSDNLGITGVANSDFAIDPFFYPRMALDSKDNLYIPVPYAPTGAGGTADGDVNVIQQDGTVLHNWSLDTDQWLVNAAVPGLVPAYPGTLSDQRAEHFYAFGKDTDENSDDQSNTQKIRLVTATPNTGAARTKTDLLVTGGDIYTFLTGGATLVNPPSGFGTSVGSGARYVESVAFGERVFYVNGSTYVYYEKVGSTDTILEWKSTSGGEIPPRSRLISSWNGRVLLARGDDPFDFFMSKKGDPFNWDFVPPVATVDQAIRVSDSRLGAVPDIITALVPMSEDILLIGCDHSIHRMVGEPLVSGSSYDLVSDQVGMLWNSGWTKDRSGRIYFMDSLGGIQRISANGQMEDLTRDYIDERLRAIDFETYYPKLVWSQEFRGLHVYMIPYGTPPADTIVDHYFWEEQTGAWHIDQFSRHEEQPTAVYVSDGDDPDDRILLMGTEAGWMLTEDADNDDDNDGAEAQVIDSFVQIGPIAGSDMDRATRFSGFEFTLADDREGCEVSLFGSDEPDVQGNPRHVFNLEPGRNPRKNIRMRAAVSWIQMRNAKLGEGWAFESGRFKANSAGRLKPRPRENTIGT